MGICQNIRILSCQPGRNGVGGRSHDHIDSVSLRTPKHPVQTCKVIFPVSRLPGTPGRFRNADYVHPRLFHHAHILVHAGDWHIFIVVSCAKVEFICFHNDLRKINCAADPAAGRICRFIGRKPAMLIAWKNDYDVMQRVITPRISRCSGYSK